MGQTALDAFFNPTSIAVVGASPTPGKGGNALIRNIKHGFSGPIYPVNPNHREVESLRCFPTVSHIDNPVDLAILFIPAPRVPAALRDCAAHGVRNAIIESGGFAETGDTGRALQDECRCIGREAGIRIWGPNCMGLVDGRRNLVLSFLSPEIWGDRLTPGDVSLIAQSGMLSAGFLIDLMSHGVMGVSKVCSIGNKVDVDECELLDYLIEDPETAAIALYLEGITRGRMLLDIARHSPKPIVILKGGKSPQGARAALSHTASLAGDHRIVRGALTQAGVVPANGFKQMMDIARALAMVPQGIKAGRTAVLTFTGGAGILSADFLVGHGIDLADLSPDSRRRLERLFPSWMPVANPIDLWPAIEIVGGAEAYRQAVEIVMDDPGVDVLLLHAFAGAFRFTLDLNRLAALSREKEKPIFFYLLGRRDEAMDFQRDAQRLGMPVYREISRTVEAIHAVYSYGRKKEG